MCVGVWGMCRGMSGGVSACMCVCVWGGGVVSLLLERVLMYCNVAVFPFVITVYWYLLSGI